MMHIRHTTRSAQAVPTDSDATIDLIAAGWQLRHAAGLRAEEARELQAWRQAEASHEAAFQRAVENAGLLENMITGDVADSVMTRLAVRARARRRRRITAVAAMLTLLLAFASFRFWPTGGAGGNVLPERVAEPMLALVPIQRLPDGSIVELNAGAEVTEHYDAGARRVRLRKGEAHFRVEKDASRPFLVQVGDLEVRAVGTAFTVQLQAAAIEVVVTEGRVALDYHATPAIGRTTVPPPSTLVDAGRRVLVNTQTAAVHAPVVQQLDESAIERRLSWRKPRIELSNLDLSRATILLNRHNRLQLAIEGAEVGALRISGSFRPDNPEAFARIVANTFDLVAERRNEDLIVLRAVR